MHHASFVTFVPPIFINVKKELDSKLSPEKGTFADDHS